MNNNNFDFKRIDKGIAGGEHRIIFKTPDGKIYEDCEITVESDKQHHHTCVVNLIDKIKPKFKVGDVVTNSSGLYPNVKCTITEVNEELQYYCYKEVKGRTYFKDQDKLILVNNEEVRPPVEDSIKLDEFNACSAKNNVLTYNLEHYPLIRNMINLIIKASNEGKISHSFVFVDKTAADDSGIYYEEDEICGIIRWHFKELGFDVKENVNDENNYVEFIISW